MCIGLFSVPRLMCVVMIHECLVGYITRIGWNSTDSIFYLHLVLRCVEGEI